MKRVIQRPSAHVGQRSHFDQSLFQIALKTLGSHDLIQGVVEGAQVGIDLALEISREKSQFLPASMAGRVRIIRPTSPFEKAVIAMAMAR